MLGTSRIVGLVLYGGLLLALSGRSRAESCQRTCPEGTPRDAHGCCLRGSGGDGKGKAKGGGHEPRCTAGRVVVAGRCCWPAQSVNKTSKACEGVPTCPKKMSLTSDRLGCVSREVEWVRLEGGRFSMGSDSGDENERPAHAVTLGGFSLTRTEVTVAQYRECVDRRACRAPSTARAGEFLEGCNWGNPRRDDHPVNCVDHGMARAFCASVGGRLPTEAEWEFAARGRGGNTTYPWGEVEPACTMTQMKSAEGDGCGERATSPVCLHAEDTTPQGLCDMAGNVTEWVLDDFCADTYANGASENPVGACREPKRLCRGGSLKGSKPSSFSTRHRSPVSNYALWWAGFRCAKGQDPAAPRGEGKGGGAGGGAQGEKR
jgi:formylglycine-generating enzyme required for sulfatase activity